MKLTGLESEIDLARQRRNQSAIEGVVSKYHSKLHSTGSALGYLALAEAMFIHEFKVEIAYDLDTFIPLLATSLDQTRALLIKSMDFSDNLLAMAQSQTWLSLILLLSHAHTEALVVIKKVDINALLDGARDKSTYGPVALLIYYTTYSWICHSLKDSRAAILNAEEGLVCLTTYDGCDCEAFAYWEETLIFTLSVLLKSGNHIERGYQVAMLYLQKHTATFAPKDVLKAISILHHYISLLIARLGHSQPLSGIPDFNFINLPKLSSSKETIIKEISLWLPIYEEKTTQIYPFPQGENETKTMADRHARVILSFDWWVQVKMFRGRFADEGLGPIIERHYSLLEILYRGTNHSFHSLRLLRYICHTFYSLISISQCNVCLDEIEEAKRAVETYVFHWEKKFTLQLDSKKKEKLKNVGLDPVIRKRTLAALSPYLSHRLSGQITQFPDYSSFSFTQNQPIIEADEDYEENNLPPLSNGTPGNLGLGVFLQEEFVVISEVDKESISDVVGVLITGMKILLLSHEGNIDLLERAAFFGDKAFIVVNEHASLLSDYKFMLSQVFGWLGVVYGELSLEVVGREERNRFKSRAAILLRKSRNHCKTNPQTRYQLALQFAEMGEFQSSLEEINRAILLNSFVPCFYNLLALLLSSKSNFEKALEAANFGWKQCISIHTTITASNEMLGGFDEVINLTDVSLRFTILALEMKILGVAEIKDKLQTTFSLLRRIIGVPVREESKPEEEDAILIRRPSSLAERRKAPSNIGSMRNSPVPKIAVGNMIPKIHRVSIYDMQITLWLTTSSVYRELGQIEKALIAVEESEKLLLSLSQVQHQTRNRDSRLFETEDLKQKSNSTRQQASGGYWKELDPVLARIQADIALEKAFIQYAKFKIQQIPLPDNLYLKHLSPIARVEAERQSTIRKQQRAILKVDSNGSSHESLDSISVTATIQTEYAAPSLNLDSLKSLTSVVRPVVKESLMEDDLSKVICLDQIISSVQYALLFDLHHLPARTFLGLLYREKGDLGQSEHHLSKSCTHQKHRGSSSGRSGLSSIYGGFSSQWGWYSWSMLASSLNDLGRQADSHGAVIFSLELQQSSCIRGYEVLSRLTSL